VFSVLRFASQLASQYQFAIYATA